MISHEKLKSMLNKQRFILTMTIGVFEKKKPQNLSQKQP